MDMQELKIFEALNSLREGTIDKETFKSEIKEIERHVQKTKRGFIRNLNGNPQLIQDKCRVETEKVYDLLDEYLYILDDISSSGDIPDEEMQAILYDKLSDLIENINKSFFEFREALLISWGPFEHGGINLLIAMAYKAKTLPVAINEVTQEIEPLLAVAYEISGRTEIAETEVMAQAIASWHNDYIKLLENYKNIKQEELDVFIEELQILGSRYYAIDLPRIIFGYSSNEDILAVSDIILECSGLYLRGYLPAELFKYALELAHALLEQLHSLIPINISEKEDTETDEEMTLANNILDSSALNESVTLMEEAISSYYEHLERNDNDLTTCDELLKNGNEMFLKSMEYLKMLADREGKIPCMRCGNYTSAEIRFCSNCNAALPAFLIETHSTMNVMDDSSYDDHNTVMTTNINALFEAAEEYYKDGISEEEFKNEIDNFELLIAKAKQVTGEEKSENTAESEILESYDKGVSQIHEGAQLLRSLLDSKDKTKLEQGKEKIWSGAGQLQNMQKKIREQVNP